MEMILNELSIQPLSANKVEANKVMITFAETANKAKENGFNLIRSYSDVHSIELSQNYTLFNWLIDKETYVDENYRNYLIGKIIKPFIKDEDEKVQEEYINANYYFEDRIHSFPKIECIGLAAAYLYKTLSISFSKLPVWQQTKLPIIIEEKGTSKIENVFNVSSKKSFEDSAIVFYVENSGDLTLEKTIILPDAKNQHLADHHGKKELQSLCDRLKNSPYVIEMRSTNWGGNDFIRKIHSDGIIEIVMNRTERKYALWVKTTGKNFRQTKAIAEILDDNYS
jgi:hypothetical protein